MSLTDYTQRALEEGEIDPADYEDGDPQCGLTALGASKREHVTLQWGLFGEHVVLMGAHKECAREFAEWTLGVLSELPCHRRLVEIEDGFALYDSEADRNVMTFRSVPGPVAAELIREADAELKEALEFTELEEQHGLNLVKPGKS